ncbi:MAG TPA: tripartite tricarboxylate transporter substrate-binding protein, partial [Burkholderiales bacterium]|nr:tripartite tricarboxylate transporter substrate-binding protein [Burkholderiales bacterium]
MRFAVQVLLLVCGIAAVVQAQPYPAKPVRMIVGFTPGGATDIISRILGQQLTESFGKPVVIENRPGASGMIGAELVARAQPDGYTLYMASQTTHAVAPYMYAKAPYDPVRDFAAVCLVVNNPLLLVTHPSLRIATVKDLVALAKSRPGQLSFATGGVGASGHMSAELFKSMVKIDMLAVHYKGDSAALTDVLGGQVPLMFVNISAVL